MIYNLVFLDDAWKEWNKLDAAVRNQFKKKLKERLKSPHVPKDRLSGMKNCYKIKLMKAGYRLVYQVIDDKIKVSVIGVGKREGNAAYDTAKDRLEE